jgi:transcriptional regulator with XRE-family HTH domain
MGDERQIAAMVDTGRKFFLREWRKYRGLTQQELADRAGMTNTAVSHLERGAKGYTQGSLEALARALECEPADLLARDPSSDEPLWAAWDGLSDEERPRAIAVIKALKASMGRPPDKK